MKKPIIGIIGKTLEFNEKFLWHQITCYDEIRYLIVKNGGIAIEILPTQQILDFIDVEIDYKNSQGKEILTEEELTDLDRQIDLCDGFVIQGGMCTSKFEIEIAKKIIEKDKPLIGICAGFNNILRAVGGDVTHDETRSHDHFDINYRHHITILEDSKLYSLIGQKDLNVNSLHFMIAPKEMVKPYAKITAFSDDGLVESFELEDKKFVLGFKWHPELMLDDNADNIFKSFIEACL
jgi:gamma-glutamyl-gamma-aminobutyrate hydrolase PuuD